MDTPHTVDGARSGTKSSKRTLICDQLTRLAACAQECLDLLHEQPRTAARQELLSRLLGVIEGMGNGFALAGHDWGPRPETTSMEFLYFSALSSAHLACETMRAQSEVGDGYWAPLVQVHKAALLSLQDLERTVDSD